MFPVGSDPDRKQKCLPGTKPWSGGSGQPHEGCGTRKSVRLGRRHRPWRAKPHGCCRHETRPAGCGWM